MVYYNQNKKEYFIKRFLIENQNRELPYLREGAKMIFITTEWRPIINIQFKKNKGEELNQEKKINVEEFIDIKGFKANGNRLLTEKKYSRRKINKISLVESLPNDDTSDSQEINQLEVNEPKTVQKSEKTQTKLKF